MVQVVGIPGNYEWLFMVKQSGGVTMECTDDVEHDAGFGVAMVTHRWALLFPDQSRQDDVDGLQVV